MVRTVRLDPGIGLIVQLVLLTILSAAVDLGVAGWVTGVAYGLIMWTVLTRWLHQVGLRGLGPANWVTLTRATLVGCVAALTAESFWQNTPTRVLVGIAALALVLDAVDGYVARRTGTSSMLGARFDMEVDAFLILVLSVYVARSMGAWVLAIGAMRYGYWVATKALVWMRGSPPPRYWNKVVAAIQGVVLAAVAANIFPEPVEVGAVIVALVFLVESFGRDVLWLRSRTGQWAGRSESPTSPV
jgi:phosphatidylglycerophosphate synthase